MDGPNEIDAGDHETINIGRATGKENGIPLWTSFVQKPEDFFDVNQVPDGFTLLDSSKMKDPQVQELLDFWHKRQEEGEDGIGFQFQESSSSILRKSLVSLGYSYRFTPNNNTINVYCKM